MSSTMQQQQHSSLTLFAISAVAGFTSYLCYYYYCYSSKYDTSKKKRNYHHADIPASLLSLKSDVVMPETLQSCPYINELCVAVHLALRCGNNIFQYCHTKGTDNDNDHVLELQTKGQAENFCTSIDLQNEQIVMEGIRTYFPDHDIIGEESVGMGDIPPINPNKPTWIIDPIDGTTNFVAGIPFSCVSIGYCTNGQPTLGVVYAPMTNELYIGVIGYGAYRIINDPKSQLKHSIPLQNHKRSTIPTKTLKESIICFEFGYVRDPFGIQQMIDVVHNIMKYGCRTTRSLGSGVLDLLYIAMGRFDLVYCGIATEGWKPWDYCAAYVIIQETGCYIDTLWEEDKKDDKSDNRSFDIYSKSMICATHQSLVDEFRRDILKQTNS